MGFLFVVYDGRIWGNAAPKRFEGFLLGRLAFPLFQEYCVYAVRSDTNTNLVVGYASQFAAVLLAHDVRGPD